MANQALATLETALRAKKLDRTLTSALPPVTRRDESAALRTGAPGLDASLQGGFPRGQLSEIAGPASSGRTTVALQTIAETTRRGELAAFVDTFDCLDVASAAAAGVNFDRLLWVRGAPSSNCELNIANALKAFNLVLQAGGFGCVVLDLADAPLVALRRLPFTTWLRVQRVVEGRDTACVLITPQPLARSAGGVTLSLTARQQWTGEADRSRHLTGVDLAARIVSPRRQVDGEVSVGIQSCSLLC